MEDQISSDWRTASYSGNGGGSCVEVAAGGGVLVRDSKDRGGLRLRFAPATWAAFAAQVRGETAVQE